MASISEEKLIAAFNRTRGRCHLCGDALLWENHGLHGADGAWHLEHSVPRAHGGTDHGNNLYVACIPCNLSKGTRSTRAARRDHGRTRAPLSEADLAKRRSDNRWLGGSALGLAGLIMGGPVVGLLGVGVGALFGEVVTSDDD